MDKSEVSIGDCFRFHDSYVIITEVNGNSLRGIEVLKTIYDISINKCTFISVYPHKDFTKNEGGEEIEFEYFLDKLNEVEKIIEILVNTSVAKKLVK